MKYCSLFIILIITFTITNKGLAQVTNPDKKEKTFEELFEEDARNQMKTFKEVRSEQTQAFLTFKQALDKAFSNALSSDWKTYRGEEAKQTAEKPKFEEAPTRSIERTERIKSNDIKVNTIEIAKPEIGNTTNPTKIMTVEAPAPKLDAEERLVYLETNFFQNPLKIILSDDFEYSLEASLSETVIAKFWETFSKKNYVATLQAFWQQKETLQLNDWGYYQLVKQSATQLYKNNQNEATLFTWFVLLKSGYKVRIGYTSGKAYLLMPCKTLIYEKTYFRLDQGEIFYVIEAKSGQQLDLKIANFKYPEADKVLDLHLAQPLKLSNVIKNRELKFRHKFLDYSLNISFEAQTANYFKDYPLTDPIVYFKAMPSSILATSLAKELKPYLEGKSEKETVDFLLSFVQQGFAYQTDQEQFGYEKPFTVEETLYYPYSDCEDRAALFIYLVRNLLKLKVVALDYPGHMAAAVRFNEKIEGDYCLVKGEKYIVCDPTYLNATSGQAMPELKDTVPTALPLD